MYMVPPFLAYYGALTANQSLLEESYNQIKLYRKYLKDSNSSAGGLWQHIVLGPSANDPGHWSTGTSFPSLLPSLLSLPRRREIDDDVLGNAWAAAGMLRVYATILHSQYSNPLKSHREDLGNWVNEIHDGMYAHLDPSSGLFFNYVDNSSTFLDASSTALLASTVYRNALLTGQHRHIPHAEISRKALFGSNSDGSTSHFDSNGWLTPVVNPENTGAEGSKSPEGQAFVIELEAAWSDWVNAGSPGANSGRRSVVVPLGWGWGEFGCWCGEFGDDFVSGIFSAVFYCRFFRRFGFSLGDWFGFGLLTLIFRRHFFVFVLVLLYRYSYSVVLFHCHFLWTIGLSVLVLWIGWDRGL